MASPATATFENKQRDVRRGAGVDGLPDYVDVMVMHGGDTQGNREIGAALNRLKDYLNPSTAQQGGGRVVVIGGPDGGPGGGGGGSQALDRPIVWKDFGLGTASIQVGSVVYWTMERVCQLAVASDAAKWAMGVVYAVRNVNGVQRADVCVAGPCKALLAGTMDSAGMAALRLSVHHGQATNAVDEDSSLKTINQEIGTFLRYSVDAQLNTQLKYADIVFSYSPPVSAGIV